MQAPAPIPVYRPSYLTDGLEFQGSLVESPANIFYQRIKASRASLVGGAGRMQFQWRSVSDNLLMSPTVMLRFQLKVKSPVLWNQVLQYIAVQGVRTYKQDDDTTAAARLANTNAAATSGKIGPPAICFADGDAFTNCCSSINLTFNGTSLSLNRTDKFWRDYMRTQISSEDAARIYKSSGGPYDANDAVGVAVCDYRLQDGRAAEGNTRIDNAATSYATANVLAMKHAGLTMDSGIAERCKSLYALLGGAAEGANAGLDERVLQVSYPVPVAPLNPWRGYAMPATSPYKSTPLAIPHFSAGGLDFLIEDFDKAFIRRMGIPMDNVAAGVYGFGRAAGDVGFELVENSAEIELKYFRLAHTRSLKESYRFNVWQSQTFLAQRITAVNVQQGHEEAGKMLAVGKDVGVSQTDAQTGVQVVSQDEANKTWKCTFDTINLAQVPSFLLISAPRINSSYEAGAVVGDAAGFANRTENAIRNKSANLYIKSIRLQVNNAQGHLDKAGGENEAFITAERLFEMTRENAGSHYFKEGGFRAWRDSGMAILLSSAQFAPGLMVSDGVAYPINVNIELELQNRHVDVSALDMTGGFQHKILKDKIAAQPQCTAIFTKIILATTETSATTNAMNYPLDSAERILNSAGSMR
jgi:hypothetical protein